MTTVVKLEGPLETFVEEAVHDGRFGSADEAVLAAVRLLKEQEDRYARMDALVAADLDNLLAQPSYPLEEVMAGLKERLRVKLSGENA